MSLTNDFKNNVDSLSWFAQYLVFILGWRLSPRANRRLHRVGRRGSFYQLRNRFLDT